MDTWPGKLISVLSFCLRSARPIDAAQLDQVSAHETIERICRLFEKRYPQLVKVVQEAEVDVLAFYSFPLEHRRQI